MCRQLQLTMAMLTLGTDCSGIEAVAEALQQLGIEYEHVFSSEVYKHARRYIELNHSPTTIYGDMTQRDVSTMRSVDLYVAGPPCQPYSTLNTHQSTNDVRKQPWQHCLAYICTHRPRHVILENVRAFQRSPLFAQTITELTQMGYYVDSRVLTPCDFDSPQSRNRVFIVASDKKIVWPSPVPLTHTVLDLLDTSIRDEPALIPSCHRYLRVWDIPRDLPGVIEVNAVSRIHYPYTRDGKEPKPIPREKLHLVVRDTVAPCMVAHVPGLFVNHLNRLMSPAELLTLQGFRPDSVRFPNGMSHNQKNKLIGNSISVPVLKAILTCLL